MITQAKRFKRCLAAERIFRMEPSQKFLHHRREGIPLSRSHTLPQTDTHHHVANTPPPPLGKEIHLPEVTREQVDREPGSQASDTMRHLRQRLKRSFFQVNYVFVKTIARAVSRGGFSGCQRQATCSEPHGGSWSGTAHVLVER